MSYSAAEPTVRDQIRGRVLDTSNVPATEYLIDVTYDAIIARYESWLRAGAEIAGRIYAMISGRPVALGSEGDSIRWSDQRMLSIKAAQRDFLDEAIEEENAASNGQLVTVYGDYLTESPYGGEVW